MTSGATGTGHALGDALPLLVGVVDNEPDVICVRGQHATVRLTSPSPPALIRLLGMFDGRSLLTDISRGASMPPEHTARVVAALFDAGLLIDARSWWRAFHSASANPRRPAPPISGGTEPRRRWHPPDDARPVPIDPKSLVLPAPRLAQCQVRRSFARDIALSVDPCASEALAMRIAHNSYRRLEGCRRPVASAGGLEPVHLLTIGAETPHGARRILAIDDDGTACYELQRLTSQDLLTTFVHDDVITTALANGAAVVLLCADPCRTVGKYGDRGWRYALLEAGAVAHHIALLAAESEAHCRPVGGFLDDAVAALVPGLIPLLAVIIAVEGTLGGTGACT